jgi:putative aldouronate transport system substrate-binding protein
MNKGLFKSNTLLLVSLIGLSLFGCKKSSYDPSNFLLNGVEGNPYQIVKKRQKIKIFVPRSSLNPHFKTMKMFKKLSDITNLEFEFTEVDTSAYTQVRSALWEDKNNLPDLMLFGNSTSEQVYYGEFGAFAAFNDPDLNSGNVKAGSLIDNYMPIYKDLLASNFNIPTTQNAINTSLFNGEKMWSVLSVNNVPRDLTFKMFINQKWISNLKEDGYDIKDANDIKTIEDYIEVLQAFKDGDPNRNGRNDEIPVSAKSLEYLRNFVLASYGYVNPSIEENNSKTGVDFVPITDAYKEYLNTMAYLNTNGLLDPATFSIKTDAQLLQKGLEYRLGSFPSSAAYLAVGEEYESEYELFGPLVSSFYQGEPLQWGFSYFTPDGATIPYGTPLTREVARLLDIMYSDIGQQLISYGEEGVDFIWDNPEHSSWTFQVPNDWIGTQEAYRGTITPNVGTGSGLYWNYDFVGKMNDPILTRLNQMSERYIPYLKVIFPEEIKLTYQEYALVEQIKASFDPFLDNMEYQFIKEGKLTTGSSWNQYLSDVNKYNTGKLLEIYTNAYNRFK